MLNSLSRCSCFSGLYSLLKFQQPKSAVSCLGTWCNALPVKNHFILIARASSQNGFICIIGTRKNKLKGPDRVSEA